MPCVELASQTQSHNAHWAAWISIRRIRLSEYQLVRALLRRTLKATGPALTMKRNHVWLQKAYLNTSSRLDTQESRLRKTNQRTQPCTALPAEKKYLTIQSSASIAEPPSIEPMSLSKAKAKALHHSTPPFLRKCLFPEKAPAQIRTELKANSQE